MRLSLHGTVFSSALRGTRALWPRDAGYSVGEERSGDRLVFPRLLRSRMVKLTGKTSQSGAFAAYHVEATSERRQARGQGEP